MYQQFFFHANLRGVSTPWASGIYEADIGGGDKLIDYNELLERLREHLREKYPGANVEMTQFNVVSEPYKTPEEKNQAIKMIGLCKRPD